MSSEVFYWSRAEYNRHRLVEVQREQAVKRAVVQSFKEMRQREHKVRVYKSSVTQRHGHLFLAMREDLELKLVILGPMAAVGFPGGFAAEEDGVYEVAGESFRYQICPCNHQNAIALRRVFRYTRPSVVELAPAIGVGDRIGLATPAHIRALKGVEVFPVLAQQSIRETERTARTPKEVLDDASWAVFQEGYRGGFGADADHVRTLDELDETFEAGFTMFTIDPSAHVESEADNYDLPRLKERFEKLPWAELRCKKKDYYNIYLPKKPESTLATKGRMPRFTEETLLRAAVRYSAAVAHAAKMHRRLKKLFGRRRFDIEVSVDETETPTSPSEHFFLARELRRLGVRITGLALRFVGRFEKAVDYVGNLSEFEESFARHVSIAKACGPYKLSIHSGSDKFSIYPVVGRLACRMVHLKTSGTSYLQALRVVARHDPALFREIVEHSFGCFDRDRKSYYLTTDLSMIPNPRRVSDENLEERFLDENNARQLLHVTYGSVLTARASNGEWLFRQRIRRILIENEEEHYETVATHIRRHAESVWSRRKQNKPPSRTTNERK